MKQVIFLTALLFSITGFSQSFSLNELIKISKYNEDNFDTYVTNKGYVFDEISDEEFTSSNDYTFLVNGYKKYFISQVVDKTMTFKNWITFQTPNIKNYLSIKNELKTLGYEVVGSNSFKGNYYLEYKKASKIVKLWSTSKTNQYTDKTTVTYEINFKEIL